MMTNYRDEDVFNACMNFCQIFTIFLLKKEEIENNHFIDEYLHVRKNISLIILPLYKMDFFE